MSDSGVLHNFGGHGTRVQPATLPRAVARKPLNAGPELVQTSEPAAIKLTGQPKLSPLANHRRDAVSVLQRTRTLWVPTAMIVTALSTSVARGPLVGR
jgi:hypothetical protein